MENATINRKANQVLLNIDLKIFRTIVYILVRLLRIFQKNTSRSQVLVIPSSGNGNIGDEAMLEAIVQLIDREVSVAFDSQHAYENFCENYAEVRCFIFDKVFDSWRLSNYINLIKLIYLGSRAYLIIMIGADLLTGRYSRYQALKRLYFINGMNFFGVKTRISPSAFHKVDDLEIVHQLLRYAKRNPLYVRDLESRFQLSKIGILEPIYSADIAFSLKGEEVVPEAKEWLDFQVAHGDKKVAIYNLSGLQHQGKNFWTNEIDLAKTLISRDYSIFFLPHVYRHGDDDFQTCLNFINILYEENIPKDRVYLQRNRLSPKQIRYILSKGEVVIGGRMHLLIAACSLEVPIIATSDEIKMLELINDFGLPENLYLSFSSTNSIQILLKRGELAFTREKIRGHLPSIHDRLQKFEHDIQKLLN